AKLNRRTIVVRWKISTMFSKKCGAEKSPGELSSNTRYHETTNLARSLHLLGLEGVTTVSWLAPRRRLLFGPSGYGETPVTRLRACRNVEVVVGEAFTPRACACVRC